MIIAKQNDFSLFTSELQRFPFDTKTPFRFSVAMAIQYFIALSLMIVLNCFYMVGVATLPVLFPLTDDIKWNLDSIQRSLRNKRERKRMVKPLAHFVQFHSNTTQLGSRFLSTKESVKSHSARFLIRRLARDLSNYWHVMLMMVCSNCGLSLCSQLLLIQIKMVIDPNSKMYR